jgi:hypothetical protein
MAVTFYEERVNANKLECLLIICHSITRKCRHIFTFYGRSFDTLAGIYFSSIIK